MIEGLKWLDVDPYVRRHVADHAARAGAIDPLLQDVGYLAIADPQRLLPLLDGAGNPVSRAVASVYRRITDLLAPAGAVERMALLHLRALQEAPDQAAALEPLLQPYWNVPWACWRASPPSTVLAPLEQPGMVTTTTDPESGAPTAIVACGSEVRCWDLSSLVPHPRTFELSDPVSAIAPVPDGVLIGTDGGEIVRLLVPSLERVAYASEAHGDAVRDVKTFSSRGDVLVASCGLDGSLAVWRADGLEQLAREPDAAVRAYSLAVIDGADGPILVSAGDTVRENNVRLMPPIRAWRAVSLEPLAAPEVSAGIVEWVFPVPAQGGTRVVFLTPGKSLFEWDVSSHETRAIPLPAALGMGLGVLPLPNGADDARLLFVAERSVCELSGPAGALQAGPPIETREMTRWLRYGVGHQVAGPVKLAGGSMIVSAGEDVRLWPLAGLRAAMDSGGVEEGEEWRVQRESDFRALARVGERLWSGNGNGLLQVRDSRNGSIEVEPARLDGEVVAMCTTSYDGRDLVIAADDAGSVQILDGESGEQLGEDIRAGQGLSDIAITETPEGPVLVTAVQVEAGIERHWQVRRWRVPSGDEIASPHPLRIAMDAGGYRDKALETVAIVELDGRKVVVAGGYLPGVQGWDIETYRSVLEVPGLSTGDEPVTSVTILEGDEGPLLWAGDNQGRVSATKLAEPDSPTRVQAHRGKTVVGAGVWGPDRALFSGGEDGRLTIWPTNGRDPISVPLDAAVRAIEPFEEGVFVATDRGLVAIASPARRPTASDAYER